MLLIRAYHRARGDTKRTKVLIPDSAHGTNPATAAVVGYQVANLKSNAQGMVDLAELEKSLTGELEKRATTERNMLAATSAGRRTVAEFAKTWMLKSTLKTGQPAPRMVVLFPGETLEAVTFTLL